MKIENPLKRSLVNVLQHKTAGEFLERSGEWLERAEAENNLLLGISKYFVTNLSRTNVNPYLLTVEDSILLGAAIMTPPRHLIVSRMPDPALLALTDYFSKEGITVTGVGGPIARAVSSLPIGRTRHKKTLVLR